MYSSGGVYVLARLQTDGTPDSSFNHTGYVSSISGPGSVFRGVIHSHIALQPDGKIVLGGQNDSSEAPAIMRYRPDGTLDSSFGINGYVVDMRDQENPKTINAVALQPDGKILISGSWVSGIINTPTRRFITYRFQANGSIDSTWGGAGIVATEFPDSWLSASNTLCLQPDGKIIAAGFAVAMQDTNAGFAMLRYLPTGALDTTFGTNGRLITDIKPTGNAFAHKAVLQPDGKIILAGSWGDTNTTFALARYHTDGTPDSSWADNGRLITNIGGYNDEARAVAVQPDGKIVAAGWSIDSAGHNHSAYAVTRYRGEKTAVIEKYFENNLNVYPNPVSNQIFLQTKGGGVPEEIAITDVTGKLVFNAKPMKQNEGLYTINDVGHWPSGVYFLKITTADRKSYNKIFIHQ
jgi:uncharacterized delta-60 repeat protein